MSRDRRPFHRLHAPLAHLALMAMLAVAMLPTLGRIAAVSAGAGNDAGIARALAAMCMPSRLGLDSPALIAADDAPGLPDPGMPMPASGEHCAYCLLLHALHVPATAGTPTPPSHGSAAAPVPPATVRKDIAATGGSGPRGPPFRLS